MNDLANLLAFFIRFIVIGGSLIALLIWLLPVIAEAGILPLLAGATPVALILWAFKPWKKG